MLKLSENLFRWRDRYTQVEILKWALNYHRKMPKKALKNAETWLNGATPTFAEVEKFANAIDMPTVFFFRTQIPKIDLPIPDFRTKSPAVKYPPSWNLLDTVYVCLLRQDWYHDYARRESMPVRKFVNSLTASISPVIAAESIKNEIGVTSQDLLKTKDVVSAFRLLLQNAEDAGLLVMASSIVGFNTRRKLDPDEFRGFALADSLAPLIFINSADSKNAQMFTLAHELAHIWLGNSGVSNLAPFHAVSAEQWCNSVAAEFYLPLEQLKIEFGHNKLEINDISINNLALKYKVSPFVIIYRLYDGDYIDKNMFSKIFSHYLKIIKPTKPQITTSFGGFNTIKKRMGRRFLWALLTETMAGQTMYSEAFRLLETKNSQTIHNLSKNMNIIS